MTRLNKVWCESVCSADGRLEESAETLFLVTSCSNATVGGEVKVSSYVTSVIVETNCEAMMEIKRTP